MLVAKLLQVRASGSRARACTVLTRCCPLALVWGRWLYRAAIADTKSRSWRPYADISSQRTANGCSKPSRH